MNILFLDDSKERQKSFKSKVPFAQIVSTSSSCIQALKEKNDKDEAWNIVFLDHDLGGQEYVDSHIEDCGMAVVRWIIENEPQIRHIIIHSHNGPAGTEMTKKLQEAKYNATYLPFIHMIKNLENFKL